MWPPVMIKKFLAGGFLFAGMSTNAFFSFRSLLVKNAWKVLQTISLSNKILRSLDETSLESRGQGSACARD